MNSSSARMPVSMRLPAQLANHINNYAKEASMRKTDAYLHFLQKGIEAEEQKNQTRRLSAMEESLSEILTLLKMTNIAAGTTIPTVEHVRSAVLQTAPDHPAIQSVYVFGSVARGCATEQSDIDLRLKIDRKIDFNLHDLEHFCKHIEQITGHEVNVITANELTNEALAQSIEKERVLVYERETN